MINMVAIFLGTFNPPHIGHLNCIQSILDCEISKDIEKIHIIPCNQNPNKKENVSFDIRFKMCQELFKEFSDKVVVNDIERNHKWIFTYDMLEYFMRNEDDHIKSNFLWIITKETFNELNNNKWYKSEDILSKYINKMIILGEKAEMDIYPYNVFCKQYIQLRLGINVHSTDIRNLIKNGKHPNIYLNNDVINIIKENRLYL